MSPMGKDERPAGALALPKLKPRSAAVGQFSRTMAAIVQAGVDETPQLVQQVQHAPPERKRIAAASAKDQQMARVHTRIPTPLMVELQVYCARNRTTMQSVVETLIADFLAAQKEELHG